MADDFTVNFIANTSQFKNALVEVNNSMQNISNKTKDLAKIITIDMKDSNESFNQLSTEVRKTSDSFKDASKIIDGKWIEVSDNIVKNNKKSSKSNKELSKAFNDVKWGILGLMFFFQSLIQSTREAMNATENFFGVDMKLAQFLDKEMSDSLLNFDRAMNEMNMNIESDAAPTITSLTNILSDLADNYTDLPQPIRDVIGAFEGFGLVAAPYAADFTQSLMGIASAIMIVNGLMKIFKIESLSSLVAPMLTGIIVIAAIILIFALLGTSIKLFTNTALEDLNWFDKAILTVGGFVVMLYEIVRDVFKKIALIIGEKLASAALDVLNFIATTSYGINEFIKGLTKAEEGPLDSFHQKISDMAVNASILKAGFAAAGNEMGNLGDISSRALNNFSEGVNLVWGETNKNDKEVKSAYSPKLDLGSLMDGNSFDNSGLNNKSNTNVNIYNISETQLDSLFAQAGVL